MNSPAVPRKAYTDTPDQHSSLILGSLQLLFWIFFRPSAWRNYLVRIDPALHPNSQVWNRLQWRNWALWRLLIQGYLLLPLLANLSLNLVLSGLGESGENLAFRVAVGVAVSLAFGLAFGMVVRMAVGVVTSVAVSLAFGLTFGLAVRAAVSIVSIMAFLVGIGLFYNVPIWVTVSKVVRIAGRIAGSVEAVVKPMLKFLRLVAICPFIKVGNNLLYQLDKRLTNSQFSLLRYNSAFWDEWQHQPLKGLDKHLILVMERNPDEGNAAIKYLSTRSQRGAAQAALLEMDTRRIERCVNLEAIRHLHIDLATGELELENLVGALIRSFSHISEDVNAALNQVTTYNQRLTLKSVANGLDDLSRQLTISNDEYAIRLQPVPIRWSQIITTHVDTLAKASEDRQEIDSPYITGNPLTEQQEIFVGRNDISTRIEQLLLDQRRPPLLLYGQRRMGKTSLLNNLGRLLPNSIIPMFVDLQGSASRASDHPGFLYNLARDMVKSAQQKRGLTLPPLTREALAADPFTYFEEWLDEVEQVLQDNTALLALD